MVQVGINLTMGSIPKEWQDSKVVFIPKLGKDHTQLQAWRPMTLINCIRKIGEKVVAEELHEGNLLHRKQFGSVKSRSGIDAVFREVARVQGCLARKGRVGWGLWDVKGGFQNVKMPVGLERMARSEIGKKWMSRVKGFVRERRFQMQWDSEKRGMGKINLGVQQGSPLSLLVFHIFMAPIL